MAACYLVSILGVWGMPRRFALVLCLNRMPHSSAGLTSFHHKPCVQPFLWDSTFATVSLGFSPASTWPVSPIVRRDKSFCMCTKKTRRTSNKHEFWRKDCCCVTRPMEPKGQVESQPHRGMSVSPLLGKAASWYVNCHGEVTFSFVLAADMMIF